MASALNGAARRAREACRPARASAPASDKPAFRRWSRSRRTRRRPQRARLSGVVAVVPFRIVADRVDHHPPHHPVPARHGGRLRRHRHQRIHEVRIRHAPHPGLHATHRIADHQSQVLDAQAFGHQPVLRHDHVVVVVTRELGAQPVRRLRRLSGADGVRQDDEILGRVERLARAEQLAGERRRQQVRASAAGAVQHETGSPVGSPIVV